MKAGFAKTDITPRIGVELAGFGPFLLRRSIGVRDRLWARAAAIEENRKTILLVSCDLIGLGHEHVRQIRKIVERATGIPQNAIMVHCTHTHSGPCTATYNGWGERDHAYLELLPYRIADACVQAARKMQSAALSHAETPCQGIGLNREYDTDAPPLADVLKDDWRPAKPERTDTTCRVLTFQNTSGSTIGFISYFGCHPVVCCQETRYIHGDYAGVATNMIERENPGTVGLFLQGAEGDVNTCVVHKPEKESLLALDTIAARYANALRRGIAEAQPVEIDDIASTQRTIHLTRKEITLADLRLALGKAENTLHTPGASEESDETRMAAVRAIALRKSIATIEAGEPTSPPVELQALRIGPITLLGAPLEIFQAIKNDVVNSSKAPITLVMSLTNGSIGYAPDRETASKGGYSVDITPIIIGQFPFKDIHTELVKELLELEKNIREET